MGSINYYLNIPKLENPTDFDCLNFEESPFQKGLEWPSVEVNEFLDYNLLALPYKTNFDDQFKDFEDISREFAMLENGASKLPSDHVDMVVDAKPLRTVVGSLDQYVENVTNFGGSSEQGLSLIKTEFESAASSGHGEQSMMRVSGRKRAQPLELNEIRKYFNFPISEAAKEMNVGLTVLKKRCRELNIMRWPHRKIKSLNSLISNVKELGLTNEIMILEEHKRMVEKLPDMELTERTKRLRQACFKANYKKRRFLAACY